MPGDSENHIVILGAGVTGLQCAITLLENGYKVIVIAKHLPGDASIDYASPWAGAQWRSHAKDSDYRQRRWDIVTYRKWIDRYTEEQANDIPLEDRSGLYVVPSYLYWDDSQHAEIANGVERLWWASEVNDFKVIPASQLPPKASAGVSFTSVAVDVPKNLSFLVNRARSLGGEIIRSALPTDKGLVGAVQRAAQIANAQVPNMHAIAYVNATGLGAKDLAKDDTMFPVRGQTVLVDGRAYGIRTQQGNDLTGEKYISYVIPRTSSAQTVLGGCKQVGNWNGHADDNLTQDILERCKSLCPELLDANGHFQSPVAQVGLRPGRTLGARLEAEDITIDGREYRVVHAYGHEGAGYQNSVGCAQDVLKFVMAERASDKSWESL